MAGRGCSPSKVIVINSVAGLASGPDAATGSGWRDGWETWDAFIAGGRAAQLGRDAAGELLWKRLDFNWPLWILFSSGTTGMCMINPTLQPPSTVSTVAIFFTY